MMTAAPTAPTLSPDEIPAMLESPQFAELPPERRTDILERALADGASSLAGQWDRETFQKWGDFASKARERVAGMESVGEKVAWAGGVVKDTAADMLKTLGVGVAGLSPVAAPRDAQGGSTLEPQVPGLTLGQSLGVNAGALMTGITDKITKDAAPVESGLEKLKQEIDQGAFFDHEKGFGGWLDDQAKALQEAQTAYYQDENWAQQNSLTANPENAAALQDYLMTRSPQAWDRLRSTVLRTPGGEMIRAARDQVTNQSELGRSLPGAQRYITEATDPAEMIATVGSLGAGRAAIQGGRTLLQRGGALAAGAAGEVAGEQVSAFMDDPNLRWEQRGEIAKQALVASLGLAGAGAGISALAGRGRTSNVPSPAPAEAGQNPFAGPIAAPPQPTEAGGVVEAAGPQPVPPLQDDPLGTAVPVGGGNVIADFGIQRSPQAQAVVDAETAQRQQMEATARSLQAKAGNGRPVIPDSPLGVRDILDFVNEHPLNLPRKGTELGRSGEFDWTQGFEMPAYYRKYLVSTDRGYAPDQLAQMAYDEGLIAEPSPDALTSAIQDTMRTRTQFKAEFRAKAKEMKAAEAGQRRFDASQAKPQGKVELGFEDIAPGDSMTIDGEPAVIRRVDYDEDGYLTEVVIEDGKKFGVMSLDPQTGGGILVDAKSYQPREPIPGAAEVVTNEDGSVDISLPEPPALQDPTQTITGSNVQTGTEMPVPPPTAEAGAGAGVTVEGQDIVDPVQARRFLEEVGWQGANARLAEAYKATLKPLNEAVQAAQQRRAEIENQLPPGWSTVELPSEPEYDRYRWKAIKDENGNDVAWPMSQDEYLDRAWREYGADKQPDAQTDPVYQELTARVKQLREISDAAHAAWRAIGEHPRTAEWNAQRAAEELAAANRRAAAAKGQRTRSAKKITPTSTTATPPATAGTPTAAATSAAGRRTAANQTSGGGRGASGQAVEMMTPVEWVDATQSPGFQRLFRESGQINQEAILAPYRDAVHAAILKGKPVSQEAMKHVTGYGFPKGKLEKAAAKYRWSAEGDYRLNSSATSTTAALPANLQMPVVQGPLPSSYGGALPPQTVKAWSGKLRTIHGIRQHLLRAIGLPAAGVGRFTKKALGIYQVKPETIRLQAINDVPVLAHEIGHALHFRVLSENPAKASDWGGTYDAELNALGAATSAPGYTPDQIRKEGVAEFVRLWLTDGAKARASAPRFSAFFEQQLTDRAPQMAKALREGRDMIEDYIAMPAMKKAEAQVVFDPALERPKSTWREWARAAYVKWFNTLHPIEKVLKRVESVEPSLAEEARRLAAYTDNHRGGWSSKAHADVFVNQTNLKGERVGESFAAILKDIQPGRAKALSTYLALKRAAEIERSGKRSGFENARLPAEEMRALEKEFEGVRQRLMKWQQNELNLLVESGLLDAKSVAAMREANRDYVPFYRLYERVNGVSFGPEGSKNAGGFVDLNSGIKRLKGSDRAIIDPLQSMMKNAFMFRKIAEQNQIGQQFFDLIEQVQGHGQWGEGIKPKLMPTTIKHADVVAKLKEQGIIEDESDLPGDADLTLRLWEAVKRPDTANGEVIVFKNGKRKHYEVKDKLLMEALKTADADAIRLGKFLGPTMTKIATLPTKVLRFGATGGPWFALPNFVRDQWTAGLQSKTGFLPFVDGIKGAFNVIAKTDAYQRWIEAGGKFHGITTGGEAFSALTEDALPKDRSARAMLMELGKPRNWIKAIGAAGQILEEASRVQEFIRAERMGLSRMDAANASKAITLNFARAGERARVFNMLVPFLNAQLQQLDVLVNLHKDPQRRGQVISRGLMLITVPSVLTWWLGKDDEEIQNLPEWRKNLFWNLNLKPVAKALGMGEGFILSVPKPFLMGAIYGTSVERMLDMATARDPNGARKAMGAIFDQIANPMDMAMSLAGMRPMIEATANYDLYRGRDIVPQSMQDVPAPYQYDLSTSETAKLLGRWTGQSPMMIDHLVRGYFATAGQWGTGALDWGMAKLGVADVPPAPARGVMELPILNKFSGSPYAANAWLPRFYDAAHEMEGLLRVWNKQSQQMTTAEQAKWWKQHGNEVLHYQRTVDPQTGRTGAGDVRQAMERVSELGKAMKEVQQSRVLSPEAKRQRLIELSNQRNKIAEESYKAVFPKAVRERHY